MEEGEWMDGWMGGSAVKQSVIRHPVAHFPSEPVEQCGGGVSVGLD